MKRDQKEHGGIIGYSTYAGTAQRWVLTSHIYATMNQDFKKELGLDESESTPKYLGKSGISFGERHVNVKLNLIRG